MPDVDLLAVLVAGLASLVLGFAYYSVVPAPGDAAVGDAQPPPWKLAVELGRGLVLAVVVAGLAARGEVDTAAGGLLLGLALWVGFPAVLWTGAMLWESTSPRLAGLHAGDWLVKLLAIGVLVSVL